MDSGVLDKLIAHLSGALEMDVSLLCVNKKTLPDSLFCNGCEQKCDFLNTHIYGTYEAARWGGRYIYFCHLGLTFLSAVLYDDSGGICSGMIAGPVIMGQMDNYDDEQIIKLASKIPVKSTKKINDIAEVLFALASTCGSRTGYFLEENLQRSAFLNELYEASKNEGEYPISAEKELQGAISDGDKNKSREILNKLLGHIYFSSNGDFNIIKARILELIVLLSRASIDGGADVVRIFDLSASCLNQAAGFHNFDDMNRWLASVMNLFVSYVFDFADVKHVDIIQKTVRYIREHCSEKISLEEIAQNVYLSKSYISKIFKDEMNMNITAYINKLRIEKSKILLLDTELTIVEVANAVGFEDQSYFTKAFRKVVGASPGKYKEARGKFKK